MTLDGLLALLSHEVDRAGGIRPLSRRWGIDCGHISRVLRKERQPGPIILKRLGMRERVEYEVVAR